MIVEIRHLTKRYGAAFALKDVSLSIEGGGVVGLLGPNGAGKTTLVETLEGLQTPTIGSVAVLGYDPTRQARALRERIGVQLQYTALPHELTPFETLRLFAAFFRKSLPPAQVLDIVRLTGLAGIRNDRLSLGQRQRLAIGVALINDPDVILLDEPTEGLDAEARREIHQHIETLRESGKTVLLTTHYIEEAERLCDRVIVLRAGEVIADGSPAELAVPAGPATLTIVLRGRFDAAPLLKAGAVARAQAGEERHFTAADPRTATLALGTLLRQPEVTLVDLRLTRPTLEDVYLRLMRVEPSPHPEAGS